MYKYVPVFLTLALVHASATVVATCDSVTNQGTLTASCNDGAASASALVASSVHNDNRDVFDLNVNAPTGAFAFASYMGAFRVSVSTGSGSFAPRFLVSNWNDVAITLNGIHITQGNSTRQISFFNGETLFTVDASVSDSGQGLESLDMRIVNFWDSSGHASTPDYNLTPADVPIPEPSGLLRAEPARCCYWRAVPAGRG